jgi:hypothetical protein
MSVIKEVKSIFSKASAIAYEVDNDVIIGRIISNLTDITRPVNISNTEWVNELPNGTGIYFFEIKFPSSDIKWDKVISSFGKDWGEWKENKEGNTPEFQVARSKVISSQTKNNDWIPLYIGKSKTLKSRIKEHVINPTNITTSALRLGQRKTELNSHNLRLSYIDFDLTNEEYKMIHILEESLRKKLNPIIGKQ